MADCIINPSFLRGFDFKLLYAPTGAEEYRVMSHDPLTGELLCLPWGHHNILRSTDWGYTFERLENFLPENGSTPRSNVVVDARYGIGRHVFMTHNSKLLDAGSMLNNANSALLQWLAPVGTIAPAQILTPPAPITNVYPGGVGYANGVFLSQWVGGVRGIWSATQWNGGAVTGHSNNNSNPAISWLRWPLTRGSYVYGLSPKGTGATQGSVTIITRRTLPMSNYAAPAPEQVAYFVGAEDQFEISDFKDYSGVQPDGAVAIERNGRMWRCEGEGMTDWVRGEDPPVPGDVGAFPHIAAGLDRFGRPALVSLNSSGDFGLVSTDHGQTSYLFELPREVGLTLPGGVAVSPGTVDPRYSRCYDIKYISDPASNHTKGRWILCGGLAVWEMVPVYGE